MECDHVAYKLAPHVAPVDRELPAALTGRLAEQATGCNRAATRRWRQRLPVGRRCTRHAGRTLCLRPRRSGASPPTPPVRAPGATCRHRRTCPPDGARSARHCSRPKQSGPSPRF